MKDVKLGLILEAKDSLGRKILTRIGVEDQIDILYKNLEELLNYPESSYVQIIGSCYVKHYHGEEK